MRGEGLTTSSDIAASCVSYAGSACQQKSVVYRHPKSQKTRDFLPSEAVARGLEADVHLPSRAHRCLIPIYRRPPGALRVSCALGLRSYTGAELDGGHATEMMTVNQTLWGRNIEHGVHQVTDSSSEGRRQST